MDPEDYEYILNEQKKLQNKYISRKNCVLAAIEEQLLEQKKMYPNRKIGLVIFGNDVQIIGDGSQVPIVIAGDKLQKQEICFEEGRKSF